MMTRTLTQMAGLIFVFTLISPFAWAQQASGSQAQTNAASAPNFTPANVLILMNAKNGQAAGFTMSKTIEGNYKVSFDPRRARYMDVNSLAMVDEITAGAAGKGKRQAYYESIDPDLLNKMWQEVVNKLVGFGVGADSLKWEPSLAAISGDLRNPGLSGDVFFLHPRVDLPLLQRFIDRGELLILGEVDASALIAQMKAAKEKQAESVQKREARNQTLLAKLPEFGNSIVSFYLLPPKDSSGKLGVYKTCTVAGSGDLAEWTTGMRYHEKFSKGLGIARDRKFDMVAKDLNELYEAVQTGKCQVPVMTNDEAIKMSTALQRDKIPFNFYIAIPKTELVASFAESYGFKSAEKYAFSKQLNPRASSRQIDDFDSLGVKSVEELTVAIQRMKKANYGGGESHDEVIQFLRDESEGKDKKLTAFQVKDARDKRYKAEAKAREDEERARQVAYAKDYPYIAVLSCGMPNHINILACFSGSHGVDTELKIRSGGSSNMYKAYNMSQAGKEKQDGFYIDLAKSFEITAQNSHSSLILTLKIIDRASGKVLYKDQAAHYGVVSMRN
ncbi:hypothetical protein H8K35_02310 [Undibacterium sp. LX40W]|uniref:Uncharacterized protein n=1 Tax=Undibacterium nitidum TaxID=2762298 RepID=A0A923KS14_9BURK|nr:MULTISPECIES: hypothetical protein [Undibacterium]MBC3880786.1 hypothetical protein [Undibacterium nitidum]MBC3890481.1 hypothetical protein [Undibacterium sp. LX40W]